jgi:hypothetical protein
MSFETDSEEARRSMHAVGSRPSNDYSKKIINLTTGVPERFPCKTIDAFVAVFVEGMHSGDVPR